ncbi:MAG: FAD-dependent monooxygenase [Polyangiales bacterium]
MGDIVIAGAGIGGLTAAIALKRAGHRVRVLERATSIKPVGAGLTVQINAVRALESLGLADAVKRAGRELTVMDVRTADGELLQRADVREMTARFGGSQVAIHRAALHEVLLREAGDVVTLGAGVTGFREVGAVVEATCSDGSTVSGDVLVGADGIHSAVRAALHGESAPRYSGYTSWRGVCPDASRVSDGCEAWGRGRRFGYVPIAEGVYWFAVDDRPEGERDAGDVKATLRGMFAGWYGPIPSLIDATPAEAILRTDIHDRDPIANWGRGRVTLLGDAAHPMTPNLGQGACQAIEDGVVLARAVQKHGVTAEALRRYERAREAHTARVVLEARRFGVVGQASNPLLTSLRDFVVRVTPSSLAVKSLAWLYAPSLEV